jgi:heterodisulfide reductase subunit A2
MKIGVYFCRCGGILSEKIDEDVLARRLSEMDGVAYVKGVELACADDGKNEIIAHLREERPDRVVFVACSPREHEGTFRGVLEQAGMNPFLMQMVNAREHIAWVTEDPREATEKTIRAVRAAVARVRLHQRLERREVEVTTDVLIIGAGPAGLKAALTLAEAGRKVVLVEKEAILGGMPVRYEEVFPRMECGPCVLEPFMAEIMHGPHAGNIEIHLQSELVEAAGSFGNFLVKIRERPRYVDLESCIGCAGCISVCPVTMPSAVNFGLNQRHAMDFTFFGGLPNVPYIEMPACRRSQGEDCTACSEACPIPGTVKYDDSERILEKQVGAILVAVGSDLYDCRNLPNLGYGRFPDVLTSLEFERILSASGPTEGHIRLSDGRTPESVAIVHCAGSLDSRHKEYCSGVCCLGAFKFNKLVAHKLHGTHITHYYKSIVVPGKDEYELYRDISADPHTRLVRFENIDELAISAGEGGRKVVRSSGESREFDLVILMPAMVPSACATQVAQMLDLTVDPRGFFEELHGRVDATKSKVRGIYLAGTCQAPMNLGSAMTQGASASGAILSALVPGRKLELEAIHAEVDVERCSSCKTCLSVCPYKAVSHNEQAGAAEVNPVLCLGCGTCVAACPSGAMQGKHFTTAQIMAEIEGALA